MRYPKDHPDPKLRRQPVLDADGARKLKPCTKPAMPGQKVCRYHGGLAPQAIQAAKLRLQAATEPLVAELVRIALNTKGSEADRTRAIVAALDRAGFRPGLDINVEEPLWIRSLREEFDVTGKLDLFDGPSFQDDDDVIEAEVVGPALTPEAIAALNQRVGGERFAAAEAPQDTPEARAEWVSASEALPKGREWDTLRPRQKRSRR